MSTACGGSGVKSSSFGEGAGTTSSLRVGLRALIKPRREFDVIEDIRRRIRLLRDSLFSSLPSSTVPELASLDDTEMVPSNFDREETESRLVIESERGKAATTESRREPVLEVIERLRFSDFVMVEVD
jgi:hypothetical protein